jgi:hypothetical protein
MKKLTHDEFVEKANIVHNNKYVYVDNYVKSKQYINIKCPIHGIFKQKPNDHLSGYGCKECGKIKTKETFLKKYGVENPMQNVEIKEKTKKTNLEKYGCENPSQNEQVKEKTKKTNLKKYGVEYPIQCDEIKEKMKKTIFEKYGVEYTFQNKEIKEKFKKTIFEKYGVEYPIQCDEIKEKMKKTIFEKYGVKHPLQNDEVKEKMKKTNLKKYGVSCAMQNKKINDIIRKKLEEKCIWTIKEKLPEFEKYRIYIKNLTKRNKKELFNNWDGYDYYDGEYIKENLNLKSGDKNYPTIDHKISVFYGFHNNIPPENISDINNLVITKKSLNSSKKNKDFNLFIESLK